MWLDKLYFTLLLCEEFFDVLGGGGLVVHDIYLGFEAFGGKYIELFLVCVKHAYILHSRDWGDQDCVGFVMVQYKKNTCIHLTT